MKRTIYIINIVSYDPKKKKWSIDVKIVKIKSPIEREIQKRFFTIPSITHQPLIISLHTWFGDYKENDSLSILAIENNIFKFALE